ncbi:hypothetical protein JAAARDRAFT_196890 [Jaapia argillacea MUCL 33604]|uniref:Uncharacterized protein n=1 Tax=Jaapia argillacea MUCL 33604 TaxID=933084 RepID=A0A067PS63_9AGAM|nr:hypothetical protein JAAARDRAFT_196890 [Jaapia argillacea MUCL 33604]
MSVFDIRPHPRSYTHPRFPYHQRLHCHHPSWTLALINVLTLANAKTSLPQHQLHMTVPIPPTPPSYSCNFTPLEAHQLLRVLQELYHLEGAPSPSEAWPLLRKLSEAASQDVSSFQGGGSQELWRASNPSADSSSLVQRSVGGNTCYALYDPEHEHPAHIQGGAPPADRRRKKCCKRGAQQQVPAVWEAVNSCMVLSEPVGSFIGNVAGFCLEGATFLREAGEGSSVSDIVGLCVDMERGVWGATMKSMLSYICLKASVQRVLKDESGCQAMGHAPCKTHLEVYNNHTDDTSEHPTYNVFSKWVRCGTYYACISGGGTLYMLFIIICFNMKFQFESLSRDVVYQLVNTLQDPDPDCIIPTINILIKNVPFNIQATHFSIVPKDMFEMPSIPAYCFSISNSIFDLFSYNIAWPRLPHYPLIPSPIWAPSSASTLFLPKDILPLQPRHLPLALAEQLAEERKGRIESMRVTTIRIDFDPKLEVNSTCPVPNDSPADAYTWTEAQRSLAEEAYEPTSIEDLELWFKTNFSGGRKLTDGYVVISEEMFPK